MNAAQQKLLEKIADHIGSTAQQAWVVLVHMHRINGIIDMFAGLLVAVVLFALSRFLYGRSKIPKTDHYDDRPGVCFVFSIITAVVGALLVIISLDANLLEIIYPQGVALGDLLSKIS